MSSAEKSGIADRLQAAMKEKDLTQIDLARKIGVTQSAVSLWLKGTKPNRKRITQIAIHLSLDEHWLLTGEGEKEFSLEARRLREEAKAAQTQIVQRLIGDSQQRTRTVKIHDALAENERSFDFNGATEEQWSLIVSQIELANYMVTQSERNSHPS